MIHLTEADYRLMPWANGKGTTTELWRHDHEGRMAIRLSRASVVEEGPFSLFAGFDRTLTVLTGPGFDLVGDEMRLSARELVPVSFSGDLAIRATGVSGRSDDLNVMVDRRLYRADTTVISEAEGLDADGVAFLCLYALEAERACGRDMAPGDLIVSQSALDKGRGRAIVVRVFELPVRS